ncbi:hypothetical protein ACQKNX_22595 [Lysinibacillus sp. NPDC093712]|uniref:hypothetical protein n=1 Tax=Lysinibacillus sp. NPDC093712 TaxID=3390579 RepID=UPI003CFD9BD3
MIIHTEEYYTFEKTLNILQIMKMYFDHKGDVSIFKNSDIHTSDYNGAFGTIYPLDICIDIINELFEDVKVFHPYSNKDDDDYSAFLNDCLSYTNRVDLQHLHDHPINTRNKETAYIKFIEELIYSSYMIFIEGSTKHNPYFINLKKPNNRFMEEFILAEGVNKDCFCIIIDEDFHYSNNMENLVEFLLKSKRIIEVEGKNR